MMQEVFRPILEELEAGRSAVLHRTVDGVEYTRLFRPRERLILLGGGHIAQPLCRMAAMLDFDVTVVDDRPDFAAASRFPEAAHTVCDAFAAAIASNTTAAGSLPSSWRTISHPARSAHTVSCSAAAARNVSPAHSRTFLP